MPRPNPACSTQLRFAPVVRAVLLLPSIVLAASGCNTLRKLPLVSKITGHRESDVSKHVPVLPAKPTPPAPPQIDYAKVRPNELGRIPVVMYHEIGGKIPKRDVGLVRSVADFEKDLDLLYAAGFRPVNMGDVMAGKIDVPAGMSPVVLTFDDARETQFRLLETDKSLKVDPTCAVGVLQAFNKKHADWGLKATFFVLPKSKATLDAFGQYGLGDQKLQYLLDKGFEIGNHTVLHHSAAHMTPEQLQAEIGGANNLLLASVPKAKISVVALPMGVYPRNKADWKYLISGSFEGKTYSYDGAMAAAFRPVPSPFNKQFNPLHMERISPMDKDPNGLRNWIVKLSAGSGNRFVSDGDPRTVSYPKSFASLVNDTAIKSDGLVANAYAPFGGAGGAKPIIADGDATGSDTASTKSIAADGESTKADSTKVDSLPTTAKPISGN